MTHHDAGTVVRPEKLIDPVRLTTAYFTGRPDPADPAQQVVFGTNGHRGSALRTTFNEHHVAAISQAVADHRRAHGNTGPLFLGSDPHALSEPAMTTALEVFAANGITTVLDAADGHVPTPAVSHAILAHNRRPGAPPADGVVLTPSHNPPADGGFKYNERHGGPADAATTRWIQDRANALLAGGLTEVRRIPYARALAASTTVRHDYLGHYVRELPEVLDLAAVRAAGVRIGADPLGGASVAYWQRIAEVHGLDLTVVNPVTDPTWRFMPADHDGEIRMDCSSPHVMAATIARRDGFDLMAANDADADRHAVVTRESGLLAANHFLAASVSYLHGHRPGWPRDAGVGRSMVSSAIIDRIAADAGRPLTEVPVGFKWFVPGLRSGALCFAGEESAGASFLRRDGTVWTTDKDGIVPCLLAAELTAVTGEAPDALYRRLTERFGNPGYARFDAPVTRRQRARLSALTEQDLGGVRELAGEEITGVQAGSTAAGLPFGGVKVTTRNAWFAARPSGTEDVYKVYAESFRGEDHLALVGEQARELVGAALDA